MTRRLNMPAHAGRIYETARRLVRPIGALTCRFELSVHWAPLAT